MTNTPTPHNAAKKGDIAKTVLMPGDPLRAKYIADTYLTDVVCFNTVRNMLGYTGKYNGKEVSVMGGGMGMPSVGIYTYELFNFYDVDNIIRIGSAGAYADDIKVRDIIFAMSASTDSNYANQFRLPGTIAPTASFKLLQKAYEVAKEKNITPRVGNVLCSDCFYNDDENAASAWKKMNVLAVEMESAALYLNAQRANKDALCILTVSDHVFTQEALSAKERQEGFNEMMEIALGIL